MNLETLTAAPPTAEMDLGSPAAALRRCCRLSLLGDSATFRVLWELLQHSDRTGAITMSAGALSMRLRVKPLVVQLALARLVQLGVLTKRTARTPRGRSDTYALVRTRPRGPGSTGRGPATRPGRSESPPMPPADRP